jgi:hypothetical protein
MGEEPLILEIIHEDLKPIQRLKGVSVLIPGIRGDGPLNAARRWRAPGRTPNGATVQSLRPVQKSRDSLYSFKSKGQQAEQGQVPLHLAVANANVKDGKDFSFAMSYNFKNSTFCYIFNCPFRLVVLVAVLA